LSTLFPTMILAQGHPAPSAETVEHVRRHHHSRDWWRITTDSTRYEARVGAIDGEGLAGLETARKSPPAPDRIAWQSIARIDVLKNRKTRGQIRGLLLGVCAGFIPLANGNANSNQPRTYTLVGGALGFFLGGKLGAADVHEEPLYVAPVPAPSPVAPVVAVRETAPTDSETAMLPGASMRSTTASVVPPATLSRADSRAIEKACGRISPAKLLRIHGDFGTFHGYAATIGPEGLGGLRVETTRTSVQSPGSLTWDRVDRIEVLGNNAGRGALRGALALGALGGLLGFPIGALASDNSDTSEAAVALTCAGVGAGIGSVLGAAGGAMSSGWHVVFQRP
jgi:hypothetical protein